MSFHQELNLKNHIKLILYAVDLNINDRNFDIVVYSYYYIKYENIFKGVRGLV
jgi:hypothetical protein